MKIHRIRYEHFGGIISTVEPVSLLWVDRDYLRFRGFDGGPAWTGPDPGHLSGPVEMEIEVTTRCDLNCSCCYTQASRCGKDAPPETVLTALKKARELGVLHVAFGGGEPLFRSDLLALAEAAHKLDMLLATTTNGLQVTPEWARKAAPLFSRVNVSVDLPGGSRDPEVSLERSLLAVSTLNEAGINSGVNFIITRQTFPRVGELFEKAARAGADSVMVLRPKPSGRGVAIYDEIKLEQKELELLVPRLLEASRLSGIPFHLDCALAPLILGGGGDPKQLEFLGASGCIAGDILLTVDVDGTVRGCSHLRMDAGHISEYPAAWHTNGNLKRLRRRPYELLGKCQICGSKHLCRGGCLAVNESMGLGFEEPDPDILFTRVAFGH